MKFKIKQLGKVTTGFTPSRKEVDAWGNDIPFLTPSDYTGMRFIDTARKLSLKWIDSHKSKKIIKVPSISVTCIGSDMGKTVFNNNDVVTNQQINSISDFKCDIIDPMYLYYLLLQKKEYLHFLGSGKGSTMPILNKTDFSNIELEIPNINEQKIIARKLNILDKKIELNNKINANLVA